MIEMAYALEKKILSNCFKDIEQITLDIEACASQEVKHLDDIFRSISANAQGVCDLLQIFIAGIQAKRLK